MPSELEEKSPMNDDRNKRRLSEHVVHNAVQRLIEFRISELREYCDEVEAYFVQQQKMILERFNRQVAKYPDEQSDIAEMYGEEHSRIEEIFLTTFRYSMVVLVHSVLEVTLDDLCRRFQRSKSLATTLDTFRGDGIARAKRYLKEECKINFPEGTNEWQQIERSIKIRNCIVHTQGNVKKVRHPDDLGKHIEDTKGVTLDAAKRSLRIDATYVPLLIDSSDVCIHKILDQL
jgi:hypothetical protein